MNSARKNVLVIGAGAVGRVFGHHLAQAGANISYFVREKYRTEMTRGFTLYPLNGFRRTPIHVANFGVVSTVEEVAAQRFDAVYLTLSSPDVRGLWLRALVPALGDATLVSLQPSREDVGFVLAAGIPEARLVAGSIGSVSYAAPLSGERRFAAPATAFWFPPLIRSLFSGPEARTKPVVGALNQGGLPAARVADVHRAMAFPTALGMTYLIALERAGWSIAALHHSTLLPQKKAVCTGLRDHAVAAGADAAKL